MSFVGAEKDLHVEGKLKLSLRVRVVDLEESMDKLSQIHIPTRVEVEHREEAFPNYSRELRVLVQRLKAR